MVAKLRPVFIQNRVNEKILIEFAHEWEQRIIEMKICEVPREQFKFYNLNSTIQYNPKIFDNRSLTSSNSILVPSGWQLKQYQDAVALLLQQLIKVPPLQHRPNNRQYFFFICQQYIEAIERLQIQIQRLAGIKPPDDMLYDHK